MRNAEDESGDDEASEDSDDDDAEPVASGSGLKSSLKSTPSTSNHLPDSLFSAAKAAKDALDAKLAAREERKKRRTLTGKGAEAAGKRKTKAKSAKDAVLG